MINNKIENKNAEDKSSHVSSLSMIEKKLNAVCATE